ncbi:hypothetical protein ACFVXR_29960 [Bacillus thuringiensis]|uniref:hypothetical protein n=1 Tax=Bacillus cereus group TaxID=86661 RepID=UPI000BF5AC07|nr:hypothetical protein [Bacillus cereus]PFW12438.1 hypothetical protein COL12_04165 [Bacillus cereus]
MSYLKIQETNLPEYDVTNIEPVIASLTTSLGISRDVVASERDIKRVWSTLKETLEDVKLEYRHELLARMVVSIRVGLFSSAVNDMWNTAILALRQKVKSFGYKEAATFLKRDIDEEVLKQMMDKELIDVCFSLGFLDDDAYYFINNCRDLRNNYSSAHPSNSMLDGVELDYFMHQCIKHILGNDVQYEGFPVSDFMSILKKDTMPQQTIDFYVEKIRKSNDLQKTAIAKLLFVNFVADDADEFVRTNCLAIAEATWEEYNNTAILELLELYSEYMIKDKRTKKSYAERFFEKVGAVDELPKDQVASIVLRAVTDLEAAHFTFDNFYNERPFAQRLAESFHRKIPNSVLQQYVYVVSLCYVGNKYGTADSAKSYYEKMIRNFSLKEVEQLFELLPKDNFLSHRIKNNQRCKLQFKELVRLLEPGAIPLKYKPAYEKIIS